jgi:hypothetical protein
MRALILRFTAGIVLLMSITVLSTGCSDKTQTSENKALTKQRQDLINSRKSEDGTPAEATAGADNKKNSGD